MSRLSTFMRSGGGPRWGSCSALCYLPSSSPINGSCFARGNGSESGAVDALADVCGRGLGRCPIPARLDDLGLAEGRHGAVPVSSKPTSSRTESGQLHPAHQRHELSTLHL